MKQIMAFTALTLLIACGSDREKISVDQLSINEKEEERHGMNEAESDTFRFYSPDQNPQQTAVKTDWNKKIIKTAEVSAEIKDFSAFSKYVRETVHNAGGYVSTEVQDKTEYRAQNKMMIRVPVDQFDNVVQQLSSNVKELLVKRVSSDDVTTEAVDTRSRLETKKQVRYRYLDLLKQAKNMQEILDVQPEINSIQEDMEVTAGRLQHLKYMSALSTINLEYFQVLNPAAKEPEKPSYAARFLQSFTSGIKWCGEILLGIVTVWPILLGGFLLWGYFKYRRKKIA